MQPSNKDNFGVLITRNQGIQSRCVKSYTGNHNPPTVMIEIGTNSSPNSKEAKQI